MTQPDEDQPGEELSEEEIEELREELREAVEQADRGEFVEFTAEEIIERGMRKLRGGDEGGGQQSN